MFEYDVVLEKSAVTSTSAIKEFAELIKSAIWRSKEPYSYNPWRFQGHVFVVRLLDGIADYIYTNYMKYFRAPAHVILPVLVKVGDIVIIEERAVCGIDTYIVRKEKVIKTLEQRLGEVKRELEQIEKKLVKSRSRWLKEICELYSKEVEQLKRAIEYLKS